MKIKFLCSLLIIFIIFINLNNALIKDTASCTSYVNIQSNITKQPCGNNAENACQSFQVAAQSCYIDTFDSVTYFVSPGTYSFKNIDPFGSIINKNITIKNYLYSIDSNTLYTSVVFDLTGATNAFFNINYTNANQVTNINVNGITFINGIQNNKTSVLVNNGAVVNVVFQQCVLENNLQTIIDPTKKIPTNGGAISFLSSNPNINVTATSTFSFLQSTYQNTNSSGIQGGLIYIGSNVLLTTTIDLCQFNENYGYLGAVLYTDNKLLTGANITISNSNSTETVGNTIFYIQGVVSVKNVLLTACYGGMGFFVSSAEAEVTFDGCTFINNRNTTIIMANFVSSGLSINNSLFANNIYNKVDSGIYKRNGVITLMYAIADITNCVFRNNTAPYGSSIYSYGYSSLSTTISYSTFDSNTATLYGGIYLDTASIELSQSNNFTNNIARLGSAISCSFSYITFDKNSVITLTNNKDKINSKSMGFSCGSSCTVQGSVPKNFEENCSSSDDSSFDSSNDSNDSNNNKKGFTKAQKFGIAIGVIAGVFIFILFLILIVRKIKERSAYKPIGYR